MRSKAPALMPIFRSRHQAELLARLLLHPGVESTLTALAAEIRVPTNTLHREVVRLVDAGLLRSRSVGRSRLLSANPENRATEPLTRLLEQSFGPLAVIPEEFSIPGVERVVIFGSWAERYAGVGGLPPQDVDVLVVGSVGRVELYEAADAAALRLAMEVNPVLRSVEQWESDDDPLVEQIQTSHALTVIPQKGDGSG